jgi:hypothetical protein
MPESVDNTAGGGWNKMNKMNKMSWKCPKEETK